MEWSCDQCTFINQSGDSSCQVCLSSRHGSEKPPAELETWSCPACTFANPISMALCEICGGGNTQPSLKREAAPSGPSLKELHDERMARKKPKQDGVDTQPKFIPSDGVTILTWNVWFREDLYLEERMKAIGNVITKHQPDVVCLQEVTAAIYGLFHRSSWWSKYTCSVSPPEAEKRPYFCMLLSKHNVGGFQRRPFRNTVMGRELCLTAMELGDFQLVVATTHLESPCPAPPTWDQMFSKERVVQAKEAFSAILPFENCIFAGDMNWDDKLDGPFPVPEGWADAWLQLRPNEPGLTYDTKANPMLKGNRLLQRRLDRVFLRFANFDLAIIEMVGADAIPELFYDKEKTVRKQKQVLKLPVLPSDHFGLLLKIVPKAIALGGGASSSLRRV